MMGKTFHEPTLTILASSSLRGRKMAHRERRFATILDDSLLHGTEERDYFGWLPAEITRAVPESLINTIASMVCHAHRMGRKEAYNFLKQFVLEQIRVPDWPHYPLNDLRKMTPPLLRRCPHIRRLIWDPSQTIVPTICPASTSSPPPNIGSQQLLRPTRLPSATLERAVSQNCTNSFVQNSSGVSTRKLSLETGNPA
jgi:hypothetical protein